jgi:hypothetical protein
MMDRNLKTGDLAFVRVRLMTNTSDAVRKGEWICAQVDAQGNDISEAASVVWADEASIVTLKEARRIVKGQG